MSVEAYLVTAIGALAGCVVTLYVWFVNSYGEVKKEHKECLARELIMLERVIRLEERTGTERRAIPAGQPRLNDGPRMPVTDSLIPERNLTS